MNNSPEFPKYKTEKTALSWGCFCCTRPLEGPVNKSDYAPGRGQYSAQCSHCNSYTWFDLEQTQ